MVALHAEARTGSVRFGWTVLATALIAIVAGVILSVRAFSPAPVAQSTSHVIGDDVQTSFGIIAVEFVRSVDGITHRALAGANHGVSGLVESGNQQIQIAVALTNRAERPIDYSVNQFQLVVISGGKASVLDATAGDLPNGRILPNAGIEGHLDFTIPAAESALSLRFRDPGTSEPVVINLGTIAASGQSEQSHDHG